MGPGEAAGEAGGGRRLRGAAGCVCVGGFGCGGVLGEGPGPVSWGRRCPEHGGLQSSEASVLGLMLRPVATSRPFPGRPGCSVCPQAGGARVGAARTRAVCAPAGVETLERRETSRCAGGAGRPRGAAAGRGARTRGQAAPPQPACCVTAVESQSGSNRCWPKARLCLRLEFCAGAGRLRRWNSPAMRLAAWLGEVGNGA